MMEAVISMRNRDNWVSHLTERHSVSVRILDCIPEGDNEVRDLAEIDLNRVSLESVVRTIRSFPSVREVEVEMFDRDRALVIVSTVGCMGCHILRRTKCFLISATSHEPGVIKWTVVFSEKKDLQELVWSLQKTGAEVKLIKISSIDEKIGLTERQERIIRQALTLGYYDFPKRIGIRELAEKFNVSTATLSETLRRGQKKILEQYFEKT